MSERHAQAPVALRLSVNEALAVEWPMVRAKRPALRRRGRRVLPDSPLHLVVDPVVTPELRPGVGAPQRQT